MLILVENWLAANAVNDSDRFDAAQPREVASSPSIPSFGGTATGWPASIPSGEEPADADGLGWPDADGRPGQPACSAPPDRRRLMVYRCPRSARGQAAAVVGGPEAADRRPGRAPGAVHRRVASPPAGRPAPTSDRTRSRPGSPRGRPRNLSLGMTVGDPLAPPTRACRRGHEGDALHGQPQLRQRRPALARRAGGGPPVRERTTLGHVRLRPRRRPRGPGDLRVGSADHRVAARPIHQAVQDALATMPSLRPALTTVTCGRSFGSQEITFRVEGALRLDDLRPLMDRFGLGAQHTRLVNALAFVLGARFTLPPDTALVTLRPTSAGMEMRIDVDLEGDRRRPAQRRLAAPAADGRAPPEPRRPRAVGGAMTPIGFLSPGSLSVLSVLVRPEPGPAARHRHAPERRRRRAVPGEPTRSGRLGLARHRAPDTALAVPDRAELRPAGGGRPPLAVGAPA